MGYEQGGTPIGSVLLLPKESFAEDTFTLPIQKSSPTLHGEISGLENAGRLSPEVYRKLTIVRYISFSRRAPDSMIAYFFV